MSNDLITGSSVEASGQGSGGRIIVGYKMKFYIKDEGQTYGQLGLVDPNHYWKFKEGSGDYIYDLGSDHVHPVDLNLPVSSIWNELRGVRFNNSNYINSGTYLLNTGSNYSFCLRVIGKFESNTEVITIVKQISYQDVIEYVDFVLKINSDRSIVFGRDPDRDGVITWTTSSPGILNNKLNEIIVVTSYTGSYTKIYLNGNEVATSNSGGISVSSSPCAYFFDKMIGDINLLATYENVVFNVVQVKLFSVLRYDVPRAGRWVDFSDKFNSKGRNLLQDLSDIQQTIEKGEGQFYYKAGSVKVSNE